MKVVMDKSIKGKGPFSLFYFVKCSRKLKLRTDKISKHSRLYKYNNDGLIDYFRFRFIKFGLCELKPISYVYNHVKLSNGDKITKILDIPFFGRYYVSIKNDEINPYVVLYKNVNTFHVKQFPRITRNTLR